ncbi:hypothetical protein F3J37_18920 [Pantoea sp. Al-1710]|jgi:hypothetical protein|uniref:Uncharacterized protein n=1 Tax=Candidatus Pantoea communis TaxID=2608354 RepID=A0ABX0RY64_9GAMM|nr:MULTISPECIES: hypothetical protein [Enterobacterales]KGT89107.1 hypothetical protein NH00_16725 [Enterobacter cancerogenus]MDF7631313.1 hypothetical protein [Erwiniaceae bacterium L1_55_4]NIG20754.1 hypothetical protein [Pantoea communis]
MDNSDKILGEAAYQILARREKISVIQLNQELHRMADEANTPERKQAVLAAINWLNDYRQPSSEDKRSSSPLRRLSESSDSITLLPVENIKK